jgi:hypothetical protein
MAALPPMIGPSAGLVAGAKGLMNCYEPIFNRRVDGD